MLKTTLATLLSAVLLVTLGSVSAGPFGPSTAQASVKKSVKIYPLVNTRAEQKFAYGRYYAQTHGVPSGTSVKLQRKVSGSWKTVKTSYVRTINKSRNVGVVRFDFNTTTLNSSHSSMRFYVASTKTTKATQKTFTAHGTAAKYRSYSSKAKSYIDDWCAGVPVHVKRTGSNAAGLAYGDFMNYGTGTGLVISSYIQVAPGMSSANLRSIATHECAHIIQQRQAMAEGKTSKSVSGYGKRGTVSQKEIEADCMARYMMGKSFKSGYTQYKPCTSAEIKRAGKIVEAYKDVAKGKRGTYTQAEAKAAYIKLNR